MTWKYFELFEALRSTDEKNDPSIDRSDVEGQNYPNYAVIPNYKYNPEVLAGYYLLLGVGYGFLGSIFIGLPLIQRKYRRLGYTDWKLIENMCIPLIKSTLLCSVAGLGVGSLFEVRRIANQDFEKDYNKKVF